MATTAVAWAGFFIHNIADLPEQTIFSPESLYPTIIWILALALWLIPQTRVVGMWTLLVWAVVNAIGGLLSVLPLGFLPFFPAQTLEHYAFHLVYFATQVPLIVPAASWLRGRGVAAAAKSDL